MENDVTDIRKTINEVKTPKEIHSIISEEWPEEVYFNTKVAVGNPLTARGKEVDLAVCLLDLETDMSKGIHKQFSVRYPEEMDKNKDFELFSQTTKTK